MSINKKKMTCDVAGSILLTQEPLKTRAVL
jgi:hypothetical protein